MKGPFSPPPFHGLHTPSLFQKNKAGHLRIQPCIYHNFPTLLHRDFL